MDNTISENKKEDIAGISTSSTGDNENYTNKILLGKKSEVQLRPDTTDSELLECSQFPFIVKKSGRHKLHPFSTSTPMATTSVSNENQEILLQVQQLEEPDIINKDRKSDSVILLEDGALSDIALPTLPILLQRPGEYEVYTGSTPAIPTTSSHSQKGEEHLTTQNKRGTLSRMLKNLKGAQKFSQDESISDSEYKEKGLPHQDVPQQIEGACQKPSGTFGKMLNRMNTVSKESKTNISKAIHRISDAISNVSKRKKDEQTDKKSNLTLQMTAREKCASLSRKVSSLGSHFSKQNMNEGENSWDRNNQIMDDHPSEGNIDDNESSKQSLKEKAATLTRKISSMGSHFHNKTTQNSGSGELANSDSTTGQNVNSATITQTIVTFDET